MASTFGTFSIPISWWELTKRTLRGFTEDDCLSLAAQLAYYFFLALFPSLLFLLALASFFSLSSVVDHVVSQLGPIVPPDVLDIIVDQMNRLSRGNHGGILTAGIAGALWSSSVAIASIVNSLNRAYDIKEGRAWWKVRAVSIMLTLGLAALVLVALGLVLAGPEVAGLLARYLGFGAVFEWTWRVGQWPVAFALVVLAIDLVYYFGPDAEQRWEWMTPGAVAATILWLLVSLGFRFYIVNFTDYNAAYGAIGSVIVLLLWLYLSGAAILLGAEMNAEIEHARADGRVPGEKGPGARRRIGQLAESRR